MCLSLLVHGGVASAVYALRHDALGVSVPFPPERALEIEMVSDPEPAAVSLPAPVVVSAAEIPKPLPPPSPSLLPENKSTDLAVAQPLPPAMNQSAKAAPPLSGPLVKSEPSTVPQPVPVQSACLPARQLEGGTPANYLVNPKPAYPVEARKRREEGLVVLAVQISQEGFPSRIKIVQSSKFQLLDAAAVRAVNQWRFTPARLGKQAVVSQIEVPIHFKLTGWLSNDHQP